MGLQPSGTAGAFMSEKRFPLTNALQRREGEGGHNTGGASFKTPFLSREGEGQQTISSAPSSFCNGSPLGLVL